MPGYKKSAQTAIIFTYAPAGLGHLRVTNALYKGLPGNYPTHLLGAQDQSIATIHRIMSIHHLARRIMENSQSGAIEDVFTDTYRHFLQTHTKNLYNQLLTLINQHIEIPKKLLVIASHFGLAHQLAAIKQRLFNQRHIKLQLVVQVTDDSPQHIWYIPGADLTIVPSKFTQQTLSRYGRLAKLAPTDFVVLPYPISPDLTKKLPPAKIKRRQEQLAFSASAKICVCIPISGAAVGTKYTLDLIKILTAKSDRFIFYLVSKAAPFTKEFLTKVMKINSVKIYVSATDHEVVEMYDQIYQDNIISLEVTKPSEQAFKALLTPKMNGGSILLLTNPIGRQEYDNLYFLRRHLLLPKINEQLRLDKMVMETASVTDQCFLARIRNWRALRLPDDPQMAADFIYRLLKDGIFKQMFNWQPATDYSTFKNEVGSDGVDQFWKTVFAKFNL